MKDSMDRVADVQLNEWAGPKEDAYETMGMRFVNALDSNEALQLAAPTAGGAVTILGRLDHGEAT